MDKSITILQEEAIALLKTLIAIPSYSREESGTAKVLFDFLLNQNCKPVLSGNNVIALNNHFRKEIPTILLNSHHDTVKPNPGYTKDPFSPIVEEGKLFGLGSNDAGGPLVSLLAAFLYFSEQENLKYNIVFAGTAEEEISGSGGITSILELLPAIDCAIIGEPTQMQLAIAERGLMVLDCTSAGVAGHAAREEGDNAIYHAHDDIRWLRSYNFLKVSELLGPNKLSVTSIETPNKAHNVVPDICRFVVDCRVNELYTFEEVLTIIRQYVQCEVTPRSTRLKSSLISPEHPLVKAGIKLGSATYGSPTTSDKALVPFPALKMGPGDSARSHTADEYIYVEEIRKGIALYIQLLKEIV